MQDQEYHSLPRTPLGGGEFLPPAPTDATQPVVSDTALGQVVLAANVCITAIIVVALLLDGTQARTAIIAASAYFAVSTIAFSAVTTGALTSIVNAWQRERTERQRVAAYLALGTMAMHWRVAVEQNRMDEVGGMKDEGREVSSFIPHPSSLTEGVQRVSPLSTFVAPFSNEQQAAREAVAWAEKLYERSAPHAPDPRRVHMDGRLKQRMIGSKRGGGNRESGLWLLRHGIIRKVAGGYALNVESYPYRHYVSALRPG